jgi:acetate kinase
VHRHRQTGSIPNHRKGLALIGKVLRETGALGDLSELSAIGHRVVHGGEYFRQPTVIDNEVLERIRDMIPLAPLHNPANVMGIEVALQAAPHTPDEEFEIALQTKACVS